MVVWVGPRLEPRCRWSAVAVLLLVGLFRTAESFQSIAIPQRYASGTTAATPALHPFQTRGRRSRVDGPSTSTSLNNFMGSDGGLLGVGGPEIVR